VATDGPSARHSHTAVVYDGAMYVYGGLSKNDRPLNDVWMCTQTTSGWRWTEIRSDPTRPAGPALYQHTAVVWDRAMWVFGGATGHANAASNMLYRFRFEDRMWETFPSTVNPRCRHAAVAIDNIMVVVGGCDLRGPRDLAREIVICDLFDRTWSRIQGVVPDDDEQGKSSDSDNVQSVRF
jgi:N-acetylneuraminic acid mutarotase